MLLRLLLLCLLSFSGAYVAPIRSRGRHCSAISRFAVEDEQIRTVGSESDVDVAVADNDDILFEKQEDIGGDNDDDGKRAQQQPSPALMSGVQTGGGAQLIMEMARKLLIWDSGGEGGGDESSSGVGHSGSKKGGDGRVKVKTELVLPSGKKVEVEEVPASTTAAAKTDDVKSSSSSSPLLFPRWHPHAGISDVNPSFRTSAPIMNNEGYARAIWRNVRKRNKPSLWAYALRTYDRMDEDAKRVSKRGGLKIAKSTIHHEGALLACAKLGLWEKAMSIYNELAGISAVTDRMIFSLIKACVRGSKRLAKEHATPLDKRREPLDAVLYVLEQLEDRHQMPLTAAYINPIAAAYQSIGLLKESRDVIEDHLVARSTGPEAETPGTGRLNVNDFGAKDKASYALLVRSAVTTRDWTEAVAALEDMTEAGLYPNQRHLNSWTEVSERKSKARTTRSWKKKRDEAWLESVR